MCHCLFDLLTYSAQVDIDTWITYQCMTCVGLVERRVVHHLQVKRDPLSNGKEEGDAEPYCVPLINPDLKHTVLTL